ncbi:MAG: metallophosphoesterase [Clostridia bacterium]|nr:metallophosphoesterase [Clostridia bacterium]
MSFLICAPTVFVIGDRYEILVCTKKNGTCAIRVGEHTVYSERHGILLCQTNVHKIAIPQAWLDEASSYTVLYRETVNKKSYFPQFGGEEQETFSFRPLTKSDGIHVYHVADVHSRFEEGIETATYFGDELDLLVVNGDIAEVNRESDFLNTADFLARIAHGCVPVVFVRGNHDTRGKLAEKYGDYFPTENGETYFTFTVGSLTGIVLDCGEDKWDDCPEYGGANRFEAFRRRETEFLRSLTPPDAKHVFAISHICPVRAHHTAGTIFDIERELYGMWNAELTRLGIHFMLTAHMHDAEIIPPNGGLIPHDYPLIVGAEYRNERFLGAALTLHGNTVEVVFNDRAHRVVRRTVLTV